MIDDNDLVEDELLLHNYDFPSGYQSMAHLDDYMVIPRPIDLDMIFHRKSHHNRLLLRVSWKLGEDNFVSMTFVCDTGAPMFFYLGEKGRVALASRVNLDDLQNEYVEIDGRKALISETPSKHRPANIIGLLMLSRLGLRLDETGYHLDTCPKYF